METTPLGTEGTNDRPAERGTVRALWAIIVIGSALRLTWLFQPIRYDEAVTYLAFVSKGFTVVTTSYEGPNNHVLHSILVWVSSRVSRDEWCLRLPAFVAGCLVPLLTYLVGRRLYDVRTALFGAALTAVSVHLIEYATSARGYSMLVAFALVQILLADDVVRRGRQRDFLWFAVVTALGFYTIPTMLYPTVASVLWAGALALSMRRSVRWRRLLALAGVYGVACIGLTAALYASILKQENGWESLTANRWVEPIADRQAWWDITRRYGADLVLEWSLGFTTAGLAALTLLAVTSTLVRVRRGDVRGCWLVVAVMSVLVLVFLQRVAPFARVYMYILPAFLLAGAAGLSDLGGLLRIPTRATRAGMAVIAIAAAAFVVVARLPDRSTAGDKFPDTRAVVARLNQLVTDSDAVVYALVPSETIRYGLSRQGRKPWPYKVDASRLIVVMRDDDEIADALRFARLRASWFAEPTLIESIGQARVYELLPRDGTTPRQLSKRESRSTAK
jgi:MFS family permease